MEENDKENEPQEKKKWMEIAEVRMVVYVVPVALAITVLVLLLNNCKGG